MRALASDREITATLGVPVRRVELAAWLGSGLVCGGAGLLLADLFTSLDYTALTFLVISSLAAALIGRLRSLWVTLAGGLAVGLAAGGRDAVLVDHELPDGRAVRARDRRAALSRRHRVVTISRTAGLAACALADAALGASRARGVDRPRSAAIVAFLGVVAVRAPGRARRGLDQDADGRRDLRGRRRRPRDPVRPRRDDLARPDRAARDRHLDGDAALATPTSTCRSRCCCSSPARSPASSAC